MEFKEYEKKAEITKMLLGFPSMVSLNETGAELMVRSYAELVDKIQFNAVVGASRYFRERDAAFPPSAGEFFTKAKEIEKRMSEQKEMQKRLDEHARKIWELEAEKRAAISSTLNDDEKFF